MEFGKKVYCGNFVIIKKARSLNKKDMKALRDSDGIHKDARKFLTRGSLPYIRIESVGGGWAVEFGIQTTMFEALDALGVVRDEKDDWRTHGTEGENVASVITAMFADCTTVGDTEYQIEKAKAFHEYMTRVRKSWSDTEVQKKTTAE